MATLGSLFLLLDQEYRAQIRSKTGVESRPLQNRCPMALVHEIGLFLILLVKCSHFTSRSSDREAQPPK